MDWSGYAGYGVGGGGGGVRGLGFGSGSYPTPTSYGMGAGFGNAAEISYDTSSSDPALMAARVFVGNVNTQTVSRDKIIKLFQQYGQVIGCTVFKGFAFIQYSNSYEAHTAVSATNGFHFVGQNLDVKLACENKRPPAVAKKQPFFSGPPNKKQKFIGKTVTPRPLAPHPVAAPPPPANDAAPDQLCSYARPDTLVCGNCDTVFREWTKFRDHRKQTCVRSGQIEDVGEDGAGDEPDQVTCSVCKESFGRSWTLLKHLKAVHKLSMFVESDGSEDNKIKTEDENHTEAL